MPRILIIEDEPAMQIGLRDNLEAEGYEVLLAANGKNGLDLLMNEHPDLAILDVMLPGMSGFDVLKQARNKGAQVPVIMLTAKGEEIDKVLGLELGADDYITKPFSLREFLARVKAVLRRVEERATPESLQPGIRMGELEVDFTSYRASRGGKEIAMTAKEFDVLRHLWNHRDQTVSRDDLLNAVWGYDSSVTTRTVDNFILRLRQKVERDPAHPRCILTVHGLGYKLLTPQ